MEPESKNIANVIIDERDDEHTASAAFYHNAVPQTYHEVITSVERSYWLKAMHEELDEMDRQQVWEINPKPPGRLMDTKWVRKNKMKSSGEIRCRARLCARGFRDKNKYLPSEVYSPTAKRVRPAVNYE